MTRARDLADIADKDISGTLTLDDIVLSNDMSVADNGKVQLGAGNDLQIYHDGNNSVISDQGTGNLKLLATNFSMLDATNSELMMTATPDGSVDLYHNNVKKFETTNTGVDVTGVITTDGMTTSANINFGDNNKAIFGAGNDLQIFHNASASYITDQGTGNLVLGGDAAILLQNSAHSANMLDAYNGGRVGLYHNGTLKAATTSTGVDVTGTSKSDLVVVDSTGGATPTYSHTNNGEGLTLRYNDDSGARAADIVATGNNPAGATTAMRFFVNPNSTDAASEVMRLQNGNVGIGGVAAPFADLTVGTSQTFNNGDNYISAVFQPSISAGESAGMLFGHYPVSGYAKQGIFWERYVGSSGSGGRGNLHFVNRDATDTSVPTTADARMTITAGGDVLVGQFGQITAFATGGVDYLQIGTTGANKSGLIFETNRIYPTVNGSPSGGTVDLGTDSVPFKKLEVKGISVVNNQAAHTNVDIFNNSGSSSARGQLRVGYDAANCLEIFRVGNSATITQNATQGGPIKFQLAAINALEIEKDGSNRPRVNIAGDDPSSNSYFTITGDNAAHVMLTTVSPNGGAAVRFKVNGNVVGQIGQSTTATSYGTSSDYRLKENVADMTGAIDRVKALAPKRFNFIADSDTTVDGFLAHEAQNVVPESVTGTYNETETIGDITDADGNTVKTGVTEPDALESGHTWAETGTQPVYQNIDQAKLVPLLTGALKEAIAKIETLETQRADVEARLTALENA